MDQNFFIVNFSSQLKQSLKIFTFLFKANKFKFSGNTSYKVIKKCYHKNFTITKKLKFQNIKNEKGWIFEIKTLF